MRPRNSFVGGNHANCHYSSKAVIWECLLSEQKFLSWWFLSHHYHQQPHRSRCVFHKYLLNSCKKFWLQDPIQSSWLKLKINSRNKLDSYKLDCQCYVPVLFNFLTLSNSRYDFTSNISTSGAQETVQQAGCLALYSVDSSLIPDTPYGFLSRARCDTWVRAMNEAWALLSVPGKQAKSVLQWWEECFWRIIIWKLLLRRVRK